MSTPTAPWTLAVDFGTSNTAAAHIGLRSHRPETLPLTHQGNLMSSAVFAESPDTIDVGDVALDKAETNPAAFLASPKRIIGHPVVLVNGYDIPTWTPVAAVLSAVLTRAAAAHRDRRPSALVLTHPEAWSPREKDVLLGAARHLGYPPAAVTLISEPRAAAHFYTRTAPLHPGQAIAVFDFGGGTLDVAVLRATDDGSFDIIGARGDNGLGGKNLDTLIRRWVDAQLTDLDPELLAFLRSGGAPARLLRGLDESIQRAKELLSATMSATITVADSRTDHRHSLLLERSVFETIIAPEIDRAVLLARNTLADSGLTGPAALSALYLTGGSSRIPLVQNRVRELGPLATLDDPKTVVVQGALVAAQTAAPTRTGGHTSPASPPTDAPAHPVMAHFVTAHAASASPTEPAVPAPAEPHRRRTAPRIAAVAAAALVLVAAAGSAVWALGGEPDPPRAADQNSSNAAPARSIAPGSDEDIADLDEFTDHYFDLLGQRKNAEYSQLLCDPDTAFAVDNEDTPELPPRTITVTEWVDVNITGDTANARVRLSVLEQDGSAADADGVVAVVSYQRIDGAWRFCGIRDQ